MPSQLLRGSAAEATTHLTLAFNGTVPSNAIYSSYTAEFARVGEFALANSFAAAYANETNAALATRVLSNLGVTATTIGASSYATLASAVETAFAAYPTARGQVSLNLARLLTGLEGDATYGAAATAWNNNAATAFTYSSNAANTTSTTLTALNAPVNRTFTLTTGVDSVAGGTGDDTVLGTVDTGTAANNTFSTADVINGGAGTDTLQIAVSTLGAATTFTPTNITNVENFRVINTSANGVTVDLVATSGETGVEASSSSAAVTFDNLDSAAVTLSASSNTGAVRFNIPASKLTGSADAIVLNLTSNTGNATVNANAASIERATINAVGTNSGGSYIGAAADLKTLTVTGAGSLVIAAADLTAVTTLDASKNSGGVTYGATALNATLTGGSGNDSLTGGGGNDVINGGSGNDTINAGTGNDNVGGGDGNDTVVLSSATKDDSADGGAGTDTLSLGSALAYSASAGTDDSVNVKNFETLTFTSATAVTQNMTGLNTNNTIATYVIGGAGAATLQNVAGITTVTGSTDGTVTLGLKTNGTGDTLAVSVGSATASAARTVTLNATQYETLNVSSVGGDTNSLTLGTTNAGDGVTAATAATATQLKALTITGNKSLTVSGSGVDTALATINAADFTGSTLSLTGFGSTTAMTVTATGAYNATVSGGTGADNITGGSGNDSLSGSSGADTLSGGLGNDTLAGGTGANVLIAGAGNDTITGDVDADNADGGDGDDTITVSDGANTVSGGAGNDSITTGTGADNISGGDGNDTITAGSGADTVDAGAGDDSVTASAGNDNVSGGAGSDTIDAGTGDDTVSGGNGNDFLTISSLTNGDSIDGGDGTDRLTILAIASDATPASISSIEDFRVTTIGGGGTGITVDFTKVSGITSLVTTSNQSGGTLTVKNLPSTLTSISLADGNTAGDTVALSYSSGPTSLTINSFGNTNTATNITSLNAPLTINGKLTSNLAGDAQGFTTQVTSLGTMTTDATAITVTSDSLTAAVNGTEVTVGAITDNVLQSITVTSGNYSDITVSSADLTTTSPEFAAATLTTGTGSTVTIGEIVANSATAVALKLTTGSQGAITIGNGAVNSFTSAAVGVDINLGNQSSLTATNILADSYSSVKIVAGAGVTATAPGLTVDSTSGTISAMTLTAGVGSALTVNVGDDAVSTFKPASVGLMTVTGDGRVNLNVYDIATADTTTTSSMGAVTATGMTSSLSVLNLNASDVAKRMSITGGAGNDTLQGGSANDTITGGAGRDTLTGNNGSDVFAYSVGDSNPVAGGGAGTSVGQDTVTFVEADDTIRLNVTSADNSWVLSTHVKLGTGGAGVDDFALATSFTSATLLVQTGAVGGSTDAWDLAITKDSAWTNEATAQGRVSVNLTGTAVADTLTTGALADTVNGGAGNDTITGGTGNDSLTGSSGSDTFVFEATSNGSDTITDFTVGTDGDVLNLDAALGASAAVANSASGGVYVSPTATALATEGTSIAVGNKVLIINSGTTATTAYDTAAEVGALLVDGGAWDAVDFAINTTGFLLVGANDGTRMLLIQVTNDGTAAVADSEITIVGTITIGADGIDGLVAGNFVLV